MGKKLFLLLVISFVCFVPSCFAFPAPGNYGSSEQARASDTGELLDIPLWRLEINQGDSTYYGKLFWAAKGVWIGNWSAPQSIKPNEAGRYVLESSGEYSSMRMEIEKISDTAFTMYIRHTNSRGSFDFVAHMSKE